jgi:hypothetical protein
MVVMALHVPQTRRRRRHRKNLQIHSYRQWTEGNLFEGDSDAALTKSRPGPVLYYDYWTDDSKKSTFLVGVSSSEDYEELDKRCTRLNTKRNLIANCCCHPEKA